MDFRIVWANALRSALFDRRSITLFAAALILGIGLYPLLVRAANSILVTVSAVSFSAEEIGGAAEFPDSIAASTGFTSIPTARALFKEPRWSPTLEVPGSGPNGPARSRLALAIVGMPVDTDHSMLRGAQSRSFCLAPGSDKFTPCNNNAQRYSRVEHGQSFTLCDYDEDCWHSTAVALAALGNENNPNPFEQSGQQATTTFKTTTIGAVARQMYRDGNFTDISQTFAEFRRERFSEFKLEMHDPIALATVNFSGSYNKTTFVSRKMLLKRGLSPGTPLQSINVFREFGEAECHRFRGEDRCLLASASAQEIALRKILEGIEMPNEPGVNDVKTGAIVIIAGGALVAERCDNNPTAELIGELRAQGVLTFVAAGNDGDPNRVRFPACASQAVAVGSLTRDGAIQRSSNGSNTRMVTLYVDGDVIAMPIRGPRIPATMMTPVGPSPDCYKNEKETKIQGRLVCTTRKQSDQYDLYLAGGTLLSTAVASGVYLDLRHRFPSLSAEAVLTALRANALPSNSSVAEVDEAMSNSRLIEASKNAGIKTATDAERALPGLNDTEVGKIGNHGGMALWVVPAIVVGAGGLVATVMTRRRRSRRDDSDS